MQKVIISVTNDICTDQRVKKICNSLISLNYQPVLIGRKRSDSLPLKRAYPIYRMRLLFNKGFLFYAEYNLRLFFKLLLLKKDIVWANDLDTLIPNFLIAKVFNKRLVFDSHELFTEIPELTKRPFIRNIWKSLERFLIPKVKNGLTVSNGIVNYYQENYHTQFELIRNVSKSNRQDRTISLPFDRKNNRLIIYQGVINMGRGLDLMIAAMKHLDNAILMIVGYGDLLEKMKSKVLKMGLDNKVKFLGKLSPEELQKLTPIADVGLSLEEDLGLNYRYTLPNKLFDYIAAGIPVLTSDLPEMKKIVKEYKVGVVLTDRNDHTLAEQLQELLTIGKASFAEKIAIAQTKLNWGLEEKKLATFMENLQ